jgi:hypothetical protein
LIKAIVEICNFQVFFRPFRVFVCFLPSKMTIKVGDAAVKKGARGAEHELTLASLLPSQMEPEQRST